MTAPQQLVLPLPTRTALGRDDFFVSPSNAAAVAVIDAWRDWPGGRAILTGPAGAGKTHLARVWADMTGAAVIDAAALEGADIPRLARGCTVIEDMARIAGHTARERAAFHLHNLAQAEGGRLLMTARDPASRWGLALPDLLSRLSACQTIALGAPDDALLGALLIKLFADRSIVPAPDVVPYLLSRIPRSHATAQRVVARLDEAALTRGSGITRPLAAAVLPDILNA